MLRSLIVLAAVLASAGRAAAGEASWDYASEACSEAPIRARIVELAERDPFGDAAIAVRVRVDRRGDRIVAAIAIVDTAGGEHGRREIEAAGCEDVADAIAVVVGIVLDVGFDHPMHDAPASPPPRIEPPPPPPPPSRTRLSIGAGAAASDRLDPAVLVGARVRRARASLAVELGLGAPEVVEVAPGRVRIVRATLMATPCLHAASLAACVAVSGGLIRGRGEGLAMPATALRPFAATGIRLAWEHHLHGPFAVQAHATAQVVVTSQRYLVDDVAVWSSQPFEAWLGFAVLAQLP